MIDEKKLIEAITNGEYTTGNILLDMELEQFIKDFPKIVTAEMNFPTVHEIAKDVDNRAMDEYIYSGKTLRHWIDEIQKYQWIPCSERLPENAKHKGAFCPKYWVMTKYGQTIGWYNPDFESWFVLSWFITSRYLESDIDFDRADVPKVVKAPLKTGIVTAWMPMLKPYIPVTTKNQTNADRIRSMTYDELVDIILCPYDTPISPENIMPCVKDGVQQLVAPDECHRCMMKWLQSESEE